MTEYELHTQGASQPSAVTRYSLQTDYANGVGIPAMMESSAGDYVLHSHVRALELHNEMLLEMRKAADRQLAEALAQIEAIGAGGVPLMGDAKDAEIEKLHALIRKIMRWDIDRAVENGFIPLAIPIEIRAEITAALTQQEQAK